MKKILCICMALILALGCVYAVAEEDLQAQLDAANAKIAELQAQVDAYYPYYFAQIVATYGEDGVIWLEDVQAEYDMQAAQYASYGLDLEGMGLADMAKQSIVETAVEDAVLMAKAKELGLDQLPEETIASLAAEAEASMSYYVDYYVSYYYPDATEPTEEMIAEANAYWTSNDITYETVLQDYINAEIYAAIEAYATQGVAITEEDVQAAYEALIAENQAAYVDDSAYLSDRNNGIAIAWHPEGYRAVKHVLIKFNEDQAALYSQLKSQLTSLNAELEAIQNPTEPAEGEEPVELRTIEEVNADIAACAVEIEALYTQLLPTAEEVIAKFNEGVSFEDLIAEYNADAGMMAEPTATQGYTVSANSTKYEPTFTAGAMAIAEKGGISEPVYSNYGIHIIYYLDDIPAGEVALEEIRASVEADAFDAKYMETYNAQVAAWIEEMNVQYYLANFGVAE